MPLERKSRHRTFLYRGADDSWRENPRISMSKSQIRKRMLYITIACLVLVGLTTTIVLLLRGGKQKYKVSLLYVKLNSKHPDVQKGIEDGLSRLPPFVKVMADGAVRNIIDNLYHAELKLTNPNGESTRLSFGPKGLREYAYEKALRDSRWENEQEFDLGEFKFNKKAFLNSMEGKWNPNDYDLARNNCYDFAASFFAQISKIDIGEPLREALQQARGVDIAAGVEQARKFAGMAEQMAPDMIERIKKEVSSAYAYRLKPLCVYTFKSTEDTRKKTH